MRITVFGTGYVGLVSGVCLADQGHFVYCLDVDESKVQQIRDGKSPIYEPGLTELMWKNKSKIMPTTEAGPAVLDSEVIIIAVGTPFNGERIDLQYIEQAAIEIGNILKQSHDYKVVVVKSTVIPNTTEKLVKKNILEYSGKNEDEIGFCMNPEFLREGSAVEDFHFPDRIVLGVTSAKAENIMREVYAGYSNVDILITNPTTAEMIKYTANSYLALNVSYANEIARLCEHLEGVDSEEVFRGVILDKRVSPIESGKRIFPQLNTYLRAGCGFGGSCFPKDVAALASFFKEVGIESRLLNGILSINESQINHVFEFGLRHCKGDIRKITILGTAFKPDTDDIRESPGLKLAKLALGKGFVVNVHDYIALENTREVFGEKVNYFEQPLDAVRDADVIFVTTIWPQYLEIADQEFEEVMRKNTMLIDTRSLFQSRENKPWRKRIGMGN